MNIHDEDDISNYPKASYPVPTRRVGETLAAYAKIHNLRKVDVVQQYSMRSYQTGLYDVLSDGNVASMSRILFDLVNNTKIEKIVFTVPMADSVKGGQASLDLLKSRLQYVTKVEVELEELEYGENARANRYALEDLDLDTEALNISYFLHNEDMTYNRPHYIFICPGSPRKENPLYKMDEYEYFDKAVSLADMTFFYNKNQAVFNRGLRQFEASAVTFEIQRGATVDTPLPAFDYYFPYRLSDKDYMFEEFLHDLPQGTVVAVTDPNESLGNLDILSRVQSTVNFGVTLLKMNPAQHLDIVRSIIAENERARKNNPSKGFTCPRKIVITSKLNKTLHMGPVEMFSIANPIKGAAKLDHFKYVRGGTNEFFFEEESKRALGRK